MFQNQTITKQSSSVYGKSERTRVRTAAAFSVVKKGDQKWILISYQKEHVFVQQSL